MAAEVVLVAAEAAEASKNLIINNKIYSRVIVYLNDKNFLPEL